MEFSLRLALLNWIQNWAESRRKQVTREIFKRQVDRLTSGLAVEDEGNGYYAVRGLTIGHLQELGTILTLATECGHESALTSTLRSNMSAHVWGEDVKEARP